MPTALVTGAAGFIGPHISEAILDGGYHVRRIDTFETGRQRNLDTLIDRLGFSFGEVDIRDAERVNRPSAGVAVSVASGGQTTNNDLVKRLNDVLGTDMEPVYDDLRLCEVTQSVAELEQVRGTLGYEPTVGVQERLEKAFDCFE